MAGYETGSSADQGVVASTPRERLQGSIHDAAELMRPYLEKHGLFEEDVYAVNSLSLLGFPVPEEFRHHQATHVAGRVHKDKINDRSGLRGVIFLAKENPRSRERVVIDISDAEKPLWNLDRFLQPPPYEKEQERGFQVWLRAVMKDPEWYLRASPAYSISFTFSGMPEDFKPNSAYFDRRFIEERSLAKKI